MILPNQLSKHGVLRILIIYVILIFASIIISLYYIYTIVIDTKQQQLNIIASNYAQTLESINRLNHEKSDAYELILKEFKKSKQYFKNCAKGAELILIQDKDAFYQDKNITNKNLILALAPVVTDFGQMQIAAQVDLNELRSPFIKAFAIISAIIFLILFIISRSFYLLIKPAISDLDMHKKIFNSLFYNSSMFIILIDKHGRIVQFNNYAEQLSGYKKNELINQNWIEIFIPKDQQQVIKKVFDEAIQGVDMHNEYINPIVKKDKTLLQMLWRNNIIKIDSQNYVFSVGLDLTENIELKKWLQESEELFKKVFDLAPIGIALIDENGKSVISNQRLSDMLGYTKEELSQGHFTQFTHHEDTHKDVELFHQLMKKSIPFYTIEKRYICKDKSIIWGELTASMLFDDKGSFKYAIGMVLDITKRKNNEKQIRDQEKLMLAQSRHAAMGEMISMIAHQWRQPLAVISMKINNILADMELGDIEKSSLKKEAEGILTQVDYLSNTIEDFRSFFKPKKPKKLTNVISVMENSLNMIGKSLENENIKVVSNYSEVPVISTYSSELMQVFLNLLKNAKEAFSSINEEEEKIINIFIDRSDKYISVKICDNAGGVSSDVMDTMFEPYVTTKSESNGTGLGLYMSDIIITKHIKGLIQAGNINSGTCFKILLPIEDTGDIDE